MTSQKYSVATLVIIALVTATTLLLGALGLSYYVYDRNRQLATLRNELAVNANQLATALAAPVWNYDDSQVDKIIESSFMNNNIYGVVAHATGKVHVRLRDALWRIVVGDREFPAAGLLVEEREITLANKSIGTVKVFASLKFIEAGLRKTLILIISVIVLVDLILILSLYWLLWQILLKPLRAVERYAEAVSSNGGEGVTIEGTGFQGELESLRTSIEKMVGLLDARYAEIRVTAEELRSSREFLNNIIENIPDMIFLKDAKDLRFVRFNRAGEDLLGHSRNDLLGKNDYDFFSKDQADFFTEKDREVLRRKEVVDIPEEALQTRNRGERTMHTKKVPILNARGEPEYLLGISEDITELKWVEEELRQSEVKFRLMTEASQVGVTIIQNGRFNYVNPAMEIILGYSIEELLALPSVLESVVEEDRPMMQESLNRRLAGRPGQHVHCRVRKKDGSLADLNVFGARIMFKGHPALISTVLDITESKKVEEALRESEELFRNVFEEGPLGMAMAGLTDGRLIKVNRSLCDMLGYTEEELMRLTFVDITYPDNLAVDVEAVEAMREGKIQKHKTEKRYLKKNGEVIWATRALSKISSADGKSFYALAMIEDITKSKEAEEELRKYREHLEDLVKERTIELEEAQEALVNIVEDLNEKTVQLAQAMEQAQSADRLKSAFLATMSHELRTPLNSIIGFTGIVLQGMSGPLNEEQAKQLAMVKGSANHLLDLINDVLDISKIEAGQVQITRKSFDMRSVIEAALRTVLPLAAKKGLSLDSVIASDVGVIISDRRRVEQILINLVNNAIKFTEQGNVRIAARRVRGEELGVRGQAASSVIPAPISVIPAEAGIQEPAEKIKGEVVSALHGDFVEISVADTGIGIKAEDVGKLFIPFSQIDTGLARNHEGTGLGLSICGKLVDMLGGTIRVESEWGKGSAFTFTLPVKGISV